MSEHRTLTIRVERAFLTRIDSAIRKSLERLNDEIGVKIKATRQSYLHQWISQGVEDLEKITSLEPK